MTTIHEPTSVYQARNRLDAILSLSLSKPLHRTLLVVDSFVNSTTGACFPSVAVLAKRRGLKERAIQYHLKELERRGLLERRARFTDTGRQRSNVFTPSYVQLAHHYRNGVNADRPAPVFAPLSAPNLHP